MSSDHSNDSKPADDLFCFDTALRRIPGGMENVKKIIPTLFSECARQLDAIRTGLAEQDARKVQRGAHTIKNSADVFAATRVHAIALKLEQLGGDAKLAEADLIVPQLEREIGRLRDGIQAALARQGDPAD